MWGLDLEELLKREFKVVGVFKEGNYSCETIVLKEVNGSDTYKLTATSHSECRLELSKME